MKQKSSTGLDATRRALQAYMPQTWLALPNSMHVLHVENLENLVRRGCIYLQPHPRGLLRAGNKRHAPLGP